MKTSVAWTTGMILDGWSSVYENLFAIPCFCFLGKTSKHCIYFTGWLFNVAMDNGLFIDDSKWFTYEKCWFPIATLNNQRVQRKKREILWRQLFVSVNQLTSLRGLFLSSSCTIWSTLQGSFGQPTIHSQAVSKAAARGCAFFEPLWGYHDIIDHFSLILNHP